MVAHSFYVVGLNYCKIVHFTRFTSTFESPNLRLLLPSYLQHRFASSLTVTRGCVQLLWGNCLPLVLGFIIQLSSFSLWAPITMYSEYASWLGKSENDREKILWCNRDSDVLKTPTIQRCHHTIYYSSSGKNRRFGRVFRTHHIELPEEDLTYSGSNCIANRSGSGVLIRAKFISSAIFPADGFILALDTASPVGVFCSPSHWRDKIKKDSLLSELIMTLSIRRSLSLVRISKPGLQPPIVPQILFIWSWLFVWYLATESRLLPV